MGRLGWFFSVSIAASAFAGAAAFAQDVAPATFNAPYAFAGPGSSAPGLSVGHNFAIFGKLGTTLARPDTAVLGNAPSAGPEQGFGLSCRWR